ncbi:MAG: class A beta-lactamase-related serine hydrolase [Sphingomonas sp.]|uniref:serine hydrolase domain-containing protein n=1 Tax=Sphingomonas sp. TaxID=28214 RepID=UPI0011FBD863|nr:serine hydrolase domain-containing protein [Sphingomonas sp.]THD34480.1 MAG: class A beta-lactamase-related serine hydrolase [Sphingomonas sp.]
MTIRRNLPALPACVVALTLAGAPSVATPLRTDGAVTRQADAERMTFALPSLSVAISRPGEERLAATGLANIDDKATATPRTIYRFGSITKPITAVAVLQLYERGRLDLDAPIQRYCPDFPVKAQPITARLLLGHQAGIRDYDYKRFREEFLSSTPYPSIAASLSIFANDPLKFEPGSKFLYSSWGYVLLGCVVEGAARMRFQDYVSREILRPARMTDTGFTEPSSRAATPYGRDGTGFKVSPTVDLSDRVAAGALRSTPRDLARFAQALMAGRLLRPATVALMWTEGRTSDGRPTGYGLGWRISDGGAAVWHGGSSVGGSSFLLIHPREMAATAFATNVDLWTEGREQVGARLLALPVGASKVPQGR